MMIFKYTIEGKKLYKIWLLLHYLESTQQTYLLNRDIYKDMIEMYQDEKI